MAFGLLVLGAVCSTTNLGLLGVTAIAPFAAFALIFNGILGRCLDPPEDYTWIHFISSSFIVAGLAVSCSQIKTTKVVDYTEQDMWDMFTRDWVLATTCALFFFMFMSAVLVQYSSAEYVGQGNHPIAPVGDEEDRGQESFNTYAGPPQTDRNCCLDQCEPLLKETRHFESDELEKSKKKPFDFSRTRLGLLYYSLMCGLCSGMNSAMLKVLVELIKDGSKHLIDYPFYCLLAVLIPLIITQAYFLNSGLRRHESIIFIPPMTSMIIVCNAGSGHMYFDEGDDFEQNELILFYLGIIISIVGACIITLHDPTKKKKLVESVSSESGNSSDITGTTGDDEEEVTEPSSVAKKLL